MKRQLLYIAFAIAVVFSACKKSDSPTDDNSVSAVGTNISYGSDAAQKMDIFLPPNRSTATTKVMIMIHGGGWTSGDKAELNPFVDTMKRRLPDYAIFNINYRLSTGTTNVFPTQENDIKDAIEFIYNKRTEYNISDKIVLIGASAGAHLAMLQAYKQNSPTKPKAVVSFFGPSDLLDMYNNPAGGNTALSSLLATAVGTTPTQNPSIYPLSSPLNFITNTAPPTILLHGSRDPLVSPSQSQLVKDKLTTQGVINQYVLYPGLGHGDWDNATYANAFTAIQAFLTANVR
jgi:acetyl esterase/lipase